MAVKSARRKKAPKPQKMNRDARRIRTMSIIFLAISIILILSMVLSLAVK